MEQPLATSTSPLRAAEDTNANGSTDSDTSVEKHTITMTPRPPCFPGLRRGPPTKLVKGREGPVRIATKSYNNQEWLHSRSAREVRILCEYLEVEERLRRQKVLCTFLFFGSARARSPEDWQVLMKKAELLASDPATHAEGEEKIAKLNRIKWMCPYWVKIKELAKKLSTWLLTLEARQAVARLLRELPAPVGGSSSFYSEADVCGVASEQQPCVVGILTGGGPGMMEAGNCGASEVKGARSMGMSVSLPHEEGLNPYVDSDLAFEFHYFFTRKFWMMYSALGVVVAPGGLGSLDELTEVLTLKQTKKMKRDVPIILFGKQFWKEVINFDKLVDTGVVEPSDRDQLLFTDDVDEAFEYMRNSLLHDKLVLNPHHIHKSRRTSFGQLATNDCY